MGPEVGGRERGGLAEVEEQVCVSERLLVSLLWRGHSVHPTEPWAGRECNAQSGGEAGDLHVGHGKHAERVFAYIFGVFFATV